MMWASKRSSITSSIATNIPSTFRTITEEIRRCDDSPAAARYGHLLPPGNVKQNELYESPRGSVKDSSVLIVISPSLPMGLELNGKRFCLLPRGSSYSTTRVPLAVEETEVPSKPAETL